MTQKRYLSSQLAVLEMHGISTDSAKKIAADLDTFSGADDDLIENCESPIERMYLLQFYGIDELGYERLHVKHDDGSVTGFLEVDYPYTYNQERGEFNCPDYVVRVFPQFQLEFGDVSYRVDFILICSNRMGDTSFLVVEVDGHDFHERTKEQVASDNARDRRLLKLGFPVIRFSGSEVFASPKSCAIETLNISFALCKEPVSETKLEQMRQFLPLWSLNEETDSDETPSSTNEQTPKEAAE